MSRLRRGPRAAGTPGADRSRLHRPRARGPPRTRGRSRADRSRLHRPRATRTCVHCPRPPGPPGCPRPAGAAGSAGAAGHPRRRRASWRHHGRGADQALQRRRPCRLGALSRRGWHGVRAGGRDVLHPEQPRHRPAELHLSRRRSLRRTRRDVAGAHGGRHACRLDAPRARQRVHHGGGGQPLGTHLLRADHGPRPDGNERDRGGVPGRLGPDDAGRLSTRWAPKTRSCCT